MAGERTKKFPYFGREALAGGLNISDNPLIISPSEMTKAENILIGQTLARRKRPGQVEYHTGSFAGTASYPTIGANNPIRGIIQYWRTLSGVGQVEEDVVLHQGSKVWRIPNQSSAGEEIQGALSLPTSGVVDYQVFEGILYALSSDTTHGYIKWNGLSAVPGDMTAATDPIDGPGKYLGVYRSRMLMAGNEDFPFRLYISAALDAETWVGADTTSLDLDYDGDPEGITSIFPEYQGSVFVATRRSLYEVVIPDPSDVVGSIYVRRISNGVGCASHSSVVATPNDVLWCSDRGVHSLKKTITSDQTEVTFLSRDIQKIFTNQLAFNLIAQASAVWEETLNIYIISVPSSGQTLNDTILSYNLTYGYWTTWTDVDARSLSTVQLSNKKYVLAGREDGRIAYLNPDVSTDFDAGFTGSFRTGKITPGGDITKQWHFKSVTILASSTDVANVQVAWTVDSFDQTLSGGDSAPLGVGSSQLGSTFVLGSSTLGIGRFLPRTFTVGLTGYNIQLEIVSGGDSNIEFYGFILEVDDADPQWI